MIRPIDAPIDPAVVRDQLRYERELRQRFRRRARQWDLAIAVLGWVLAAFTIGWFVGRSLWGAP